jgi:hypothetical protein
LLADASLIKPFSAAGANLRPFFFLLVVVMPVMTGGGMKRNAITLRAGCACVAPIGCGVKDLRLTRR